MDDLARRGATLVIDAFDEYRGAFDAITRRARARFEARDWRGVQADARDRLGLYSRVVTEALARMEGCLSAALRDRETWRGLKSAFLVLEDGRDDRDLLETFFNSVTRRLFSTVGIDPEIEFVRTDPVPLPEPGDLLVSRHRREGTSAVLVQVALRALGLGAPWRSLERDAALASAEIERELAALPGSPGLDRIELANRLFFRNKAAYVVGRAGDGETWLPLVLCLLHEPAGIVIDAVLPSEEEVSIVFSFTRSYFHVECSRPSELVGFLKKLMPRKPVNELYNSIGQNKHGKTVLYRDLLAHIRSSGGRFETAPGDRGMVMAVFVLSSYDLIVKVIRDRFPEPKSTTREEVASKYRLVFTHDRAGRLVDAQEFEHLTFDRSRFSPEVIRELQETARLNVEVTEDRVVLRHCYTERRLVPLNLYLRSTPREDARRAIVDFGQAIRDLAATNVFPGDVLLKNFGVTRHGRVVFYDYDELALLTDCVFRDLPEARYAEDEMRDEPWYYVGPNDIFPEEFLVFLGVPADLKPDFLAAHGDLLRPEFWRDMQAHLAAGEILELYPYRLERRIPPPA